MGRHGVILSAYERFSLTPLLNPEHFALNHFFNVPLHRPRKSTPCPTEPSMSSAENQPQKRIAMSLVRRSRQRLTKESKRHSAFSYRPLCSFYILLVLSCSSIARREQWSAVESFDKASPDHFWRFSVT